MAGLDPAIHVFSAVSALSKTRMPAASAGMTKESSCRETALMTLPLAYAILLVAIVAEVFATSMLNASQGFARLAPTLASVAGYAVAFFCLAQTTRVIPVGIAYAIWSGVGMILIAAIGWIWFRQALDAAAMIGIALILAGVLVINLLSKSVGT